MDWCKVQIRLNHRSNNPPSVSEGQIWWVHFGQNLGSEIYGKGDQFTRPVIILKKFSKFTFLVVPCSTKIKEGSWYQSFYHQNKEMNAILFQCKTIDYLRLINKVGDLDKNDYEKIKTKFIKLIQ